MKYRSSVTFLTVALFCCSEIGSTSLGSDLQRQPAERFERNDGARSHSDEYLPVAGTDPGATFIIEGRDLANKPLARIEGTVSLKQKLDHYEKSPNEGFWNPRLDKISSKQLYDVLNSIFCIDEELDSHLALRLRQFKELLESKGSRFQDLRFHCTVGPNPYRNSALWFTSVKIDVANTANVMPAAATVNKPLDDYIFRSKLEAVMSQIGRSWNDKK